MARKKYGNLANLWQIRRVAKQQMYSEPELAALAKKPAGPASASAASIPRVSLAHASHAGASAPYEESAGPSAAQAPGAVLVEPLYMQAEPVRRRSGASVAARIGRFVSFGVAGAMLGGGLGIFAVNYLGLAADWTKLAVYGPAALFAGACAVASLFSKTALE